MGLLKRGDRWSVRAELRILGTAAFPGEVSCLTPVWAVLDLLIKHETNGVRLNELDRRPLKRMRYQGTDQAIPEEVTAAQTDHHWEPPPRRIYSSKESAPSVGGAY
jgi:hypothetical protein